MSSPAVLRVETGADAGQGEDLIAQVGLPVPGFPGGRYVDACANCLDASENLEIVTGTVLREGKSGGAGRSLERKLRTQIDKDASILARFPDAKIEWHFMASNYGLEISAGVLDYLKLKGIKYVIHLPA